MYGQSLPVGTYGSTALTACEVVKQATKFLSDEFTEFFLQNLHGDEPRHIEPRTALSGLTLMVFVAIDGVEERKITAVSVIIAIAYAQIDIDAVGEIEERHSSACIFDTESAFMNGGTQCARVMDAHRVQAVAPDFHHLVVPLLGISAD